MKMNEGKQEPRIMGLAVCRSEPTSDELKIRAVEGCTSGRSTSVEVKATKRKKRKTKKEQVAQCREKGLGKRKTRAHLDKTPPKRRRKPRERCSDDAGRKEHRKKRKTAEKKNTTPETELTTCSASSTLNFVIVQWRLRYRHCLITLNLLVTL